MFCQKRKKTCATKTFGVHSIAKICSNIRLCKVQLSVFFPLLLPASFFPFSPGVEKIMPQLGHELGHNLLYAGGKGEEERARDGAGKVNHCSVLV